MKMGVGVFLLLAIVILFVLSLMFKKKGKSVKILNSILYILILIFFASISFAAIVGIDYVCPCGCGSTEFDLGFKGILNFFNEVSYGIFDNFVLYAMCVIIWCVVVHFVLLGIKFLVKKIGKKKSKK